MIEPHITDKQCKKCGNCYPLPEFKGRHQCANCQRAYNTKYWADVRHGKRITKPREKRSIIPRDDRTISEKLLDASQRRWRYPVEPAQLRWAA